MKTILTKSIKENTLRFNQFTLKSTEKVVLTSIDKVENLQGFTSKSIKKSLNFTEKQQDILFNNLEKGKGMVWKNLNKTLDFFSKN